MQSDTIVALAAAILAAGAFIVAFFQVILEYMSSSTSRNICSSSAIGCSEKRTKYGWSFTSWKLKVYYPLLKMEVNPLLLKFMKAELDNIEFDDNMENISKRHGWAFRPISSNERVGRSAIA